MIQTVTYLSEDQFEKVRSYAIRHRCSVAGVLRVMIDDADPPDELFEEERDSYVSSGEHLAGRKRRRTETKRKLDRAIKKLRPEEAR